MIRDPLLLILASAGSGKTFRLVHHYLAIIHWELKQKRERAVQRILAATFTRAAAGEIIERVLQLAAAAMRDPAKLAQLREHVDPAMTIEDCGRVLQAILGNLHCLRIGTLDSFIVRSAQSFSPELGLPTPWSICDEIEDCELRLGAIDSLLDDSTHDAEKFAEMFELLVMLNQQKYPLRVREALLEKFDETHGIFLAAEAKAWDVINGDRSKVMDEVQIDVYAAKLPALLDKYIATNADGSKTKTWETAISSMYEKLLERDWDGLAGSGFIPKILDGEETFQRKAIPKQYQQALQPLIEHLRATYLCELHDRNLATRALLAQFDERYREGKIRKSSWRFDDFPRLLNEAEVMNGLDEFYFRLDSRIDHILLDEFQDTSIAQWRMLRPLVQEIVSGQGASQSTRSFFCVGDVKQTLYRWRNAEPELVDQLRKDWPQVKPLELVESHRSCQVIIDSVNRVFENLTSNPAMAGDSFAVAATKWANWYSTHEVHAKNKDKHGFCRVITCKGGENVQQKQRNALKLAAERVQKISAALPNATIGVLMRRKKFVSRMVFELKRLGISAAGEGGSPLIDDSAVCAALSLLHLLDHPADEAAKFHVVNSPLGAAVGIASEAENVLEITRRLRRQILDDGLGATLNDWLQKSSLGFSERNFDRYSKLIQLALEFDYDGGEFATFLDKVRATAVEDPATAKIRAMTIHASKGRQFDVVILPDLDGPILQNVSGVLWSRPKDTENNERILEPYEVVSLRPGAEAIRFDDRLQAMRNEAEQRKIIEELCTLYVGMTRAISGLEMIVHPSESKKFPGSLAGVVRGAFMAESAAAEASELWHHENSKYKKQEKIEEAVVPVEMVEIAIDQPVTPRKAPVVSPSGLEGRGFIKLSNELKFEDSAGIDRGSVLHKWFELVGWIEDGLPTTAQLRDALEEQVLDERMLVELEREFRGACAKANLRRVLSKAEFPRNAELWRERSFAAHVEGQLLCGQFDRVVVVPGKRAWIIDYKSDRVTEASVTERVEHYEPQIRAYRRGLAKLTGISEGNISATLIFMEIDRVVPVN